MRLISDIEAAWHLDDSTPPLLSETICKNTTVALRRWPAFFVLEISRNGGRELYAIESAQAAWAAYHRQVSDLEQGAAQPSTNSARILDFASFKASAARKPSRATAR